MTQCIIVARITAHTGQENHVASQIDNLALATRAETGCIRYEIYRDPNDEAVTLIYEIWTSQSALQNHLATEHLRAFKAEVLKEKASIIVEKLVRESEKTPT